MEKFDFLDIIVPVWRAEDHIELFTDSILEAINPEITNIIFVLNECDYDNTGKILHKYYEKTNFFLRKSRENLGPIGVDLAMFAPNLLREGAIIGNVNTDMFFEKGFDEKILDYFNKNYTDKNKFTISPVVVEPYGTGNPKVIIDKDLQEFSEKTKEKFLSKREEFLSKTPKCSHSYNHPIFCAVDDYVSVNGYSDNFNFDFWHGYAADDYFPFRLWEKNNGKFNFMLLRDCFVYHEISKSTGRIESSEKKRRVMHSRAIFHKYTGMSIEEFKNKVVFK